MYVVIFKATVLQFDEEYDTTAATLRDLAINEYGCLDFIAATQGNQEIALSYWQNEQDIKRWKTDADHRFAQTMGREKWYKNYQIEIAKITRAYQSQES